MQNVVKKVIFKRIWLITFLGVCGSLCSRHAGAWGGFFEKIQHSIQSPCLGRFIPNKKTRLIHNLRLECTAHREQFQRGAVLFDQESWKSQYERSFNAESEDRLELRKQMQLARQQEEPLIHVSGQVPYEVREVWEWIEWVYSPHESCGHEKKQIWDPLTGKWMMMDVMKSCYHNEPRHEDFFCTRETLGYQVDFIRPSLAEWNPTTLGYTDLLPNKYDLMFGEFETIHIHSNVFQNTKLSPQVSIDPAWNVYQVSVQWDGGLKVPLPCEIGARRSIQVNIQTVRRLQDQATPNSLTFPEDINGNALEPLEWLTMHNSEGHIVRSRPDRIVLRDQSADLVEMFSKETRTHPESHELPEAGDEQDQGKGWKKFYKNTLFRVRLVQEGWNLWIPRILKINASDLSQDESENYLIPLHGKHALFSKPAGYFSALLHWFKVSLQPNRKYTLYVSLYQKDMPFYAQECQQEGSFYWLCKAFYGDSHFSKEIPIPFQTDKQIDYQSITDEVLENI